MHYYFPIIKFLVVSGSTLHVFTRRNKPAGVKPFSPYPTFNHIAGQEEDDDEEEGEEAKERGTGGGGEEKQGVREGEEGERRREEEEEEGDSTNRVTHTGHSAELKLISVFIFS